MATWPASRGADPLERRQPEGEASPRAGGASEGAGRVAEPVGVQRPGLPDAHHHQRGSVGARQHERLSGLPREPGRFEGGPIVADLVRDRARRSRRARPRRRHRAEWWAPRRSRPAPSGRPRRGIEVRGHGDSAGLARHRPEPSQRTPHVRSTRRGGPGRPGVLGNHTMHPAPDEGPDATTFVSTGRLPEPDLVQSILEDAFARVADVQRRRGGRLHPGPRRGLAGPVRCLHGERARPGARGR